MAFQQGLSGLNSSAKALDVISNNVANSNTIGFKSSRAEFYDVYAAALNGANAGVQIGIGASVGAVSQLFSQGNISTTNNPLDVAINGNGFFRMVNTDGSIAFTRNGQFDIDKDGFVVNSQGYKLTGYDAANGVVQTGAEPVPLQLDYSDVAPNPTSEVRLGMSLDSGDDVSPIPATGSPTWTNPFPLDRTSSGTIASGGYNYSTSATVYDTLGASHTLTYYFVKAGAGAWDVYYDVDGSGTATALPTQMVFDTNGSLVSGGTYTQTLDFSAVGASATQSVSMDLTASTQYGGTFGVNALSQDGFASGRLTGVTIGKDGVILGRYSNGQSRDLGQVVMANFASPNGLLSQGGNMWSESPDSGQPVVGAPGTANLGLMTAGAVEEANVDLTAELVNLIVQQRAYQANAQSVRAQDQILQTLVNLR